MVRFIGLDVHKRTIEVCVLDAEGRRLSRSSIGCSRAELVDFAEHQLQPEDRVALEATTNTWAVTEILQPRVARVVVGNPLKTRAIAEAKVKTDKVDAQLLRCDYLPSVWQPGPETRQLRKLTTARTSLTSDRTRVKNRIHAVLAQLLIEPPMAVLFTQKGRHWLEHVQLPEDDRLLITCELGLLDAIEEQLCRIEDKLAELAHPNDQVRLLMTLPGIGFPAAQTLLAALGDLSRFKDGDHAAGYLGLVPSTHQSATHCYHGHITKAGNSHARWMLTQAAQRLDRHPGPLGVFFRRLCRRKSRNVAVCAAARKLVTIAFLLLKNNEPYRYALPEPTEKKLSQLAYRATGERRRPQRILPPRRREPGERVTNVRALPDVYVREGLPPATPPDRLPAGEQKMLREHGVVAFVKTVQRPQRNVTRRSPE